MEESLDARAKLYAYLITKDLKYDPGPINLVVIVERAFKAGFNECKHYAPKRQISRFKRDLK